MKKKIGVIVPLVLIVILIQTQLGSAATYGISVGETFTYDCVASERTIVWGTNSSFADGYNLAEQHFNAGTSFLVEITEIDNYIYYSLSKDGAVDLDRSRGQALALDLAFGHGSNILIMRGVIRNHISTYGWIQADMEFVPTIPIDLLFVELDYSVWSAIINQLATLTDLLSTSTELTELTLDAGYIDNEEIFACEIHLSGIVNATYTPLTSPSIPWTDYSDDLDFYHRFAYDKTTGALLGMHSYGSMTSVSNGTIYELELDRHIEKEGYDLPANLAGFTTGGFSGYSIAITLSSITTVFIIAIVIRRKKVIS